MRKIVLFILTLGFLPCNLFSQTEISATLEKHVDVEIFTVVENMPAFQKECAGLNYLDSRKCNMEVIRAYFSKALQSKKYSGPSGPIDISFIVNKDGKVSPWKKFESGNEVVDEIIMEMPDFYSPGKQRNIAVNVLFKTSVVL